MSLFGVNSMWTFGLSSLGLPLVSAPFSYLLCRSILTQALDQMENDAIIIITAIHEEIVKPIQ